MKLTLLLSCAAIAVFAWVLAGPSSNVSAERPGAAYALLETSATPADALVQDRIRGLARETPQLQVENARVIRRAPDETLVLVPRSDDMLCVERLRTDGTSGGGCVDRSIGETVGVAFTVGPNIGVVPDGVERVDFTLRDGRRITSPVERNVYRVPAEAVEGRVMLAGNTYSLSFVPRSALPQPTGRPGEGKLVDTSDKSCWFSCR